MVREQLPTRVLLLSAFTDSSVVFKALEGAESAAPVLSQRESQVLEAFARGLSIPHLASELYISASTVKTHTQRLHEKLSVSDRAAAVAEPMR